MSPAGPAQATRGVFLFAQHAESIPNIQQVRHCGQHRKVSDAKRLRTDLRDSSPRRWTDGGDLPDDQDAETMNQHPHNIVTQKSAACQGWHGLSNRDTREPRSSESQCGTARTQIIGAGGNRTPSSTTALIARVLDAQIRALQDLRAALP